VQRRQELENVPELDTGVSPGSWGRTLFLRLALVTNREGRVMRRMKGALMWKQLKYVCLDCGCIVETRSRCYDGRCCPACDSRLFLPWEKTAMGQMEEDEKRQGGEGS